MESYVGTFLSQSRTRNEKVVFQNKSEKIPEDSISVSPEGFSLLMDAVPEESWEEIRLYLGLTTSNPESFDQSIGNSTSIYDDDPYIQIDGFDGDGEGRRNHPIKIPWESTPYPQNRPVAQFGFRYDYEKDTVVPPPSDEDDGIERVPKIPEVFRRFLLQPYEDKIKAMLGSSGAGNNATEFTQCIVNVYRPSITTVISDGSISSNSKTTTATTSCSSIPWHVDDPQFGPDILVFTFGETRPLHLRLPQDNEVNNNEDKDRDHTNNDNIKYSYFTARPSHRSCYVLSGPARHDWQHSVPSGSGWRVSITFRTLHTP